ncbi:MAG TPA: allophanate hydrolase [Hyphomicrobium sp.]|nr:allophanate hydrolase [Hyphomicrobium sp.]
MTTSLDFATLTEGYARGTFTPQDIVALVYDRIADMGERPVWVSLRSREDALARAAQAPRGPLYGLPFAVKDNIDVAGLATTCACPDFASVPARSATAVERLEAAGAIVIGKTNLDQFATGLVGTRSPYGIPVSTFNSEYISGGSSSGSAVAVASGLVSFALGTDTAGSGRVPAAFNNIVGLKPTKGLISARGLVPACRTQDTISIFALTTSDAYAAFDVAAAFDADDCYARNLQQRTAPPLPVGALRLGVPKMPLEFFGDADSATLYEAGIERARELGAVIVAFDFTPFQRAAQLLYQGPWVAERLAAIKDFARAKPQSIHDVVRGIIVGAERLTAVDAFEGFYSLAECIRQADAEWQTIDMMMLPTAATSYKVSDVLADPVRLNSNLGLYTNFVNLMDLSALAVPAGLRPDGLPFGITLLGRALTDHGLAAFGDKMHRALSQARLGALDTHLNATPPYARRSEAAQKIAIAVVGAHLTGQPLNGQLLERNAHFVRTAKTAPGYSFYALANTTPAKPGLVYDGRGAGGVDVEIWEMDAGGFGSFVALIPPPLGVGTLLLADGTTVKGFVCEAHAVTDAIDITEWGGWRRWLASRA